MSQELVSDKCYFMWNEVVFPDFLLKGTDSLKLEAQMDPHKGLSKDKMAFESTWKLSFFLVLGVNSKLESSVEESRVWVIFSWSEIRLLT